ncbi:MAG: hypothetical protein OHK0023_02990 [Anaerolineae bacterium]
MPADRYDVFISYAPQDAAWTAERLVAPLKAIGLRVQTDADFPLGAYAVTEVERAIANSSYILLILSPEWLNDRFAAYQGMLSTSAAIEGEARVVPITLRACELPIGFAARIRLDMTQPEQQPAALKRLLEAMPQLFLSYSRQDSALVDQIRADLTARGLRVWMDTQGLHSGTPDWERAIRTAINESRAVLYCGSPEALQSPYVQGELQIAASLGVRIVPLWVRGDHWIDCAPMHMAKQQYLDFRAQRDIEKLLKDLATPESEASMPSARIGATVSPALTKKVRAERRLEAAMPKQTRLNTDSEVWVKVSLPESAGLRAELPAEIPSGDVIEKRDVRASTFPIEFKRNKDGELQPVTTCLEATCDLFEVQARTGRSRTCGENQVELEVLPEADTRTVVLTLLPKPNQVIGKRARVTITLYRGEKILSEVSVNTEIVGQVERAAWEIGYANVSAQEEELAVTSKFDLLKDRLDFSGSMPEEAAAFEIATAGLAPEPPVSVRGMPPQPAPVVPAAPQPAPAAPPAQAPSDGRPPGSPPPLYAPDAPKPTSATPPGGVPIPRQPAAGLAKKTASGTPYGPPQSASKSSNRLLLLLIALLIIGLVLIITLLSGSSGLVDFPTPSPTLSQWIDHSGHTLLL